jgi:hypothetical protein
MAIDNISAVAWTDTRNTKHPEAQCALRIMRLLEATSHVFTSAEHIPGKKNAWADAVSRSWDTEDAMLRFKNRSTNYEQVVVPEAWRNPSRAWQRHIYVPRSLSDSCNHLDISFMHRRGFGPIW